MCVLPLLPAPGVRDCPPALPHFISFLSLMYDVWWKQDAEDAQWYSLSDLVDACGHMPLSFQPKEGCAGLQERRVECCLQTLDAIHVFQGSHWKVVTSLFTHCGDGRGRFLGAAQCWSVGHFSGHSSVLLTLSVHPLTISALA